MTDRTNVFAGSALDRNAELRDDAEFAAAQLADPRARFLLLDADIAQGRRALVESAVGALRWLGVDERRELAVTLAPTYLGDDGIGPLFSICADSPEQATQIASALDATFVDLRSAGVRMHAFQAGLFAYARATAHWQVRSRFCGACGARVELIALGHRGRCSNPACAMEHFPRIDPAMIVIVTWGDQCLLGHQASWSENRYSTLAGFIEPGESLEDAVRREVFEEAGVRVGECAYHSSQPWPFPSSLMLGFTAVALDPAIHVGPELSDARWFSADELVSGVADRRIMLPPRVSVSHELIADWLRDRTGLELADLLGDEPWQLPRA